MATPETKTSQTDRDGKKMKTHSCIYRLNRFRPPNRRTNCLHNNVSVGFGLWSRNSLVFTQQHSENKRPPARRRQKNTENDVVCIPGHCGAPFVKKPHKYMQTEQNDHGQNANNDNFTEFLNGQGKIWTDPMRIWTWVRDSLEAAIIFKKLQTLTRGWVSHSPSTVWWLNHF